MARDYYEFIIIDRNPGKAFTIDDVADALTQLAGDPPAQEIINKAVQGSFPVINSASGWKLSRWKSLLQ